MLIVVVGFLHLLIHFRFSVEFNQPAIITEGLAQTAVPHPEVAHFFKSIKAAVNSTADKRGRPTVDLILEVEQNDKIRNAACWGDGSFIAEDPLLRVPKEI